ncbi:uncharacterized protein [Haliotis cracherodii]|uniref:uncharacterized protein n=1 Tax=Haliotis cracherodii TaxID=6455 RepID=UPI0039EC1E3A
MVMCRSPVSLIVFILSLNFLSIHGVWELDKTNFDKFREAASFPIYFVDSPGCSRCRVLYPFFFAASQIFKDDREIIFGRVQDKTLIRQWGIDELPAIFFHEKGEKEAERLEGDITVDNIVNTIALAMPGYIGEVKRQHVIEVSDKNYDELVITPKQNVILLNYNNEERNLRFSYEEIATAFRFDEQVIFCAIDSDKYPQLKRERFGHQGNPAVFWYEADNKHDKFLYGGKIHPEALLQFVNEKTNLWRKANGRLEPRSGRIENLDNIFTKYVPSIKDMKISKMKAAVSELKGADLQHPWEADFAEYYSEMIERMIETGSNHVPLSKEHEAVLEMVNDIDGLTQKQRDFFVRKMNIVDFMASSIKNYDPTKNIPVGKVIPAQPKSNSQLPREEL